mgnify:CR=1 FL=1
MGDSFRLRDFETSITRDKRLVFTLISYGLVLVMYMNLNAFRSWVLGIVVSSLYFMINGIFLGCALFRKEASFFRLMFGILLLIMLLGFVGLLVLIAYDLDTVKSTLVLLIVGTMASLLNRRVRNKNAA